MTIILTGHQIIRLITNNTYMRSFRYKILNNVFFLNKKLYNFGIKPSPLFFFCDSYDETPYHMFYEKSFGKTGQVRRVSLFLFFYVVCFVYLFVCCLELVFSFKPHISKIFMKTYCNFILRFILCTSVLRLLYVYIENKIK